jgi:hypothetical protein
VLKAASHKVRYTPAVKAGFASEGPEQVLQFAPKEKSPRNDADALDQSGQAVLALLHKAANSSNKQCERAMNLAHQLSMQLCLAEDRIQHLQAERAVVSSG